MLIDEFRRDDATNVKVSSGLNRLFLECPRSGFFRRKLKLKVYEMKRKREKKKHLSVKTYKKTVNVYVNV